MERNSTKVLYVEDNLLNIQVMSLYLRGIFELDSVTSAEAALEKISASKYDILLLDINLGEGMNGIELAKILRNMDEYKSKPIISVTGYSSYYIEDKSYQEIFDFYVTKPFSKVDILGILSSITSCKKEN